MFLGSCVVTGGGRGGRGGTNGEVDGGRLTTLLVSFFRTGRDRALDVGCVFSRLRLAARPRGVLYISVLRRVLSSSCVDRVRGKGFHLGGRKARVANAFRQGDGKGGSFVPRKKNSPVFITRHGSTRTVGGSGMGVAFCTGHGGGSTRKRMVRVLRHTGSAFINALRMTGSCTFLIARGHALTGSVFVPGRGLGNNGAKSGTVIGIAR